MPNPITLAVPAGLAILFIVLGALTFNHCAGNGSLLYFGIAGLFIALGTGISGAVKVTGVMVVFGILAIIFGLLYGGSSCFPPL